MRYLLNFFFLVYATSSLQAQPLVSVEELNEDLKTYCSQKDIENPIESDPVERTVLNFLWAAGWDRKDSQLSKEELPKVKIGGEKDEKDFFPALKTFLGFMPKNYEVRLILDETTRFTNQLELEEMHKTFSSRFHTTDVTDLGESLSNQFPEHKTMLDLLTKNATRGAPVLTSDIFRLIAMPEADKFFSSQREEQLWTKYVYSDVDTFLYYFRGIENKRTQLEYFIEWVAGLSPKKSEAVDIVVSTQKFNPNEKIDVYDFYNSRRPPLYGNDLFQIILNSKDQKESYKEYVTTVLDALSDEENENFLKEPLELSRILQKRITLSAELLNSELSTFKEERDYYCAVKWATGPSWLAAFLKDKWGEENLKVSYHYKGIILKDMDSLEKSCRMTWLPPEVNKHPFWFFYAKMWYGKKLGHLDETLEKYAAENNLDL